MNLNLDDKVKKLGLVRLNTQTMHAPQDYKGLNAPFINISEYQNALRLAEEKYEYVLKSTQNPETISGDDYLDLRDGGTDLMGKPRATIMTGFVKQPEKILFQTKLIDDLEQIAPQIRKDFPGGLVVVGIGGSYTMEDGIKSALQQGLDHCPLYFLGQHLSSNQTANVLEIIKRNQKKVAVVIISKSGTTTEPAIAARIVLSQLKDWVGVVFAITDQKKGALREAIGLAGYNPSKYISDSLNNEFYVPDNIGGRYSVLTAVGLFPLAVAGINVRTLVEGAYYAGQNMVRIALERAASRYVAYQKGVVTEILSYNMPEIRTYLLGERQLRPESDGKFGMGLNVMDEFYTSDAHSNGQLIQSGPRNLMETFHFIEKSQVDFAIPESKLNQDGLKEIAQGGPEAISLHQANNRFMFGLLEAHYDAGVPVTSWVFPGMVNEFTVGQHTQINFISEVIFGLMLKVNPLNQPGVQAYKEAAFKLLGLRGRELRDQSLIRAKQQNIPL